RSEEPSEALAVEDAVEQHRSSEAELVDRPPQRLPIRSVADEVADEAPAGLRQPGAGADEVDLALHLVEGPDADDGERIRVRSAIGRPEVVGVDSGVDDHELR